MKGYSIDGDTIVINRDLTQLDLFVRDFLDILKKHSEYLVVSGFVSISSGRTRATEDVDLLVPLMSKEVFKEIFEDLTNNGFWCYQSDNYNTAHEYLSSLESIRFARIGETFPNMEFIPINELRKAKYFEFTHPQKVRVKDFSFKIPPIEFEILYKEIILKSNKDLEDANHLRTFFSDILDNKKFKEYEPIIRGEIR